MSKNKNTHKKNLFLIPCTCSICKNKTTLDSMVASNFEKTLYHCKDCEIEKLNNNNETEFNQTLNFLNTEIKQNKLKRALIWTFG